MKTACQCEKCRRRRAFVAAHGREAWIRIRQHERDLARRGRNATEARREQRRRYQSSPKGLAARRERERRRRESNPSYRLRRRIRGAIMRGLNGRKSERTEALLGYSVEALRAHLERQFTRGITWANYGTAWDIDHVVPLASFNLPADLRAAWALSNLRPLRKRANQSKGARRLHLL